MADNERFRRWFARLERLSIRPHAAREILSLVLSSDVTEALPRIRCPTLVLHHRDNVTIPVEHGRAMAQAIPGARFVTVDGMDCMAWLGDADRIIGEIEEFLTGSRTPAPGSELAAILFTDIVGSTELAAQLHHERWQRVLAEHDLVMRREIELAGGRVVKAIGDGFLATFPTPDCAIAAAADGMRAAAGLGLALRAGIHVGAIESNSADVHGIAVHIAARICERAAEGQILVSGTVRDVLVDRDIRLELVERRRLRGVPGHWTLYAAGPERRRGAAEDAASALAPASGG